MAKALTGKIAPKSASIALSKVDRKKLKNPRKANTELRVVEGSVPPKPKPPSPPMDKVKSKNKEGSKLVWHVPVQQIIDCYNYIYVMGKKGILGGIQLRDVGVCVKLFHNSELHLQSVVPWDKLAEVKEGSSTNLIMDAMLLLESRFMQHFEEREALLSSDYKRR